MRLRNLSSSKPRKETTSLNFFLNDLRSSYSAMLPSLHSSQFAFITRRDHHFRSCSRRQVSTTTAPTTPSSKTASPRPRPIPINTKESKDRPLLEFTGRPANFDEVRKAVKAGIDPKTLSSQSSPSQAQAQTGSSLKTSVPTSSIPISSSSSGTVDPAAAELAPEASAPDPEAGRKGAERVVREGRLPEKYRAAARKWTRLMMALPIAIVTSYYLYERLAVGVERKRLVPSPIGRANEDD